MQGGFQAHDDDEYGRAETPKPTRKANIHEFKEKEKIYRKIFQHKVNAKPNFFYKCR